MLQRDERPVVEDRLVTYRVRRVSSIRDGVRAAALAAKVQHGHSDGFAFHSLRHTAPSLLSGSGVNVSC